MKKHNYKNLETEELLKKKKNFKILIIALIVVAILLLAAEIYLVFQKDEIDSSVYFIGVLLPGLAIWVANIEENKNEINKELKSRGRNN